MSEDDAWFGLSRHVALLSSGACVGSLTLPRHDGRVFTHRRKEAADHRASDWGDHDNTPVRHGQRCGNACVPSSASFLDTSVTQLMAGLGRYLPAFGVSSIVCLSMLGHLKAAGSPVAASVHRTKDPLKLHSLR